MSGAAGVNSHAVQRTLDALLLWSNSLPTLFTCGNLVQIIEGLTG